MRLRPGTLVVLEGLDKNGQDHSEGCTRSGRLGSAWSAGHPHALRPDGADQDHL